MDKFASLRAFLGWLRTFLGVLVAPISPGLLFAVVLIVTGNATVSDVPEIMMFLAMLGYTVAIFFGIPLYLFLSWRGWNGLLTYIMAGALLGGITFVPVFIYTFEGWHGVGEALINPNYKESLWGLVGGVCMGLSFWVIARPDRTIST
jgi:hypothetical protein